MDTFIKELTHYLSIVVNEKPARIVISNVRGKSLEPTHPTRVEITATPHGYQVAKRTEKQVFHENIAEDMLHNTLCVLMSQFSQLNAFAGETEYRLRLTKKGKPQFGKQSSAALVANKVTQALPTHNQQKNYLLLEGQVIAPLVDMGIFTQEGQVVKTMYAKYKQINRFLEIVDDALRNEGYDEQSKGKVLHILDFGCGKSYLTFVLYYYLTTVRQMKVKMTGLDLKAEVVAKCNAAAKRYGYKDLQFKVGDINGYVCDEPIDMVVSLHACDTATDYALFNAVQWGVKMILSVPCCQHELSKQMKSDDLSLITRYGIVQERVAALMTDSIRANLLQACGYKAQLLEFIDLEHTAKNILIRAVRSNLPQKQRGKMLAEVRQLMKTFSFEPTLYHLLQKHQFLTEEKKKSNQIDK